MSLAGNLTELTEKLVREHHLAVEKLTEKQLVAAIEQAILSGDLMRHIAHVPNGTAQQVTYVPFRMVEEFRAERDKLRAAIADHHSQKADDRCFLDDDKLYEAAGLPAVDRRVGDKEAMLKNCARFLDKRCEAGGWPTYRELEQQIAEWRACALRYAVGHPTAEDVTIVGLAMVNDSIDAEKK